MKKKRALQAIAAIAGGLLFFLPVMPVSMAQLNASGQKSMIEFGFSARNIYEYVQPDSIKVMNRTQGCQVTLHWPDTVLLILNVGIPQTMQLNQGFRVFNNYPNPVSEQTTVTLFVPQKDVVTLAVTDLMGRTIYTSERVLDNGMHSFRLTPGRLNFCFFTVQWRGISRSIRIIHTGLGSDNEVSVEYTGNVSATRDMKAVSDVQDFVFCFGDELLFIGYADELQSGIFDTPEESNNYTFQFATNIPCLGMSVVEYEGQVYNTIQIFSQCWLKENLNVGTMIPGNQDQSDNGTIEKYCYDNDPGNCSTYGGLYQWDEMMQYTTQQGAQGICPPGWRLPTDEEWKVLEGAVDSQYGIGDPEWDLYWEGRGYDAGTTLKTTSGWYAKGNGTDLFGFSGLPGGGLYFDGGFSEFFGVGYYGNWLTSSEFIDFNFAWFRSFIYNYPAVSRSHCFKEKGGFSVRCLRDEPFSAEVPTVITAEVTAVTQTSAVCGGNVVADGGAYVTARGVVWSTTANPTVENNEGITYNGTGTGEFISNLTGLNPETEYFVRAYATNSEGNAYGEELDFSTSPAGFVCGTSTITDIDGNVYNTVLIGSQCWMKENLKVGTMIAGSQNQTNNGTIEKYCYSNNTVNCDTYGGLYQWNEMMGYSTTPSVQGICPPGWHIPTDDEWKTLEGNVDSQYGVGDPIWNNTGYRGFDAGKNLKSTTGWNSGGNGTDLYGFGALPGGSRYNNGGFSGIGNTGHWWSSSESSDTIAWIRWLNIYEDRSSRTTNLKGYGRSVRCLKDN